MEKTIQSKSLFQGRMFSLRQDEVLLPNGQQTHRDIIVHPGAVAILPCLDPDHLILIRQFRKALDQEIIEIPAGTLEPGEDPLTCAKRELIEEIGYEPGSLELWQSFYPAPGYSSEKIYLFKATQLKKVEQQLMADECIEPFQVSRTQVKEWLNQGKIQDAKTLIGLFLWLKLESL